MKANKKYLSQHKTVSSDPAMQDLWVWVWCFRIYTGLAFQQLDPTVIVHKKPSPQRKGCS